mgnify:CR=1 FL=1
MLHQTENFPAVTLRFFLTYGPGQDTERFLPQTIHSCLIDSTFPTSTGEQFRDFCYVDDTVCAILQTLVVPEAVGNIINIASGKPVTIREVLSLILKVSDYENAPVEYDSTKPTMIPKRMIDITLAKEKLGFQPKVSLEEGLQKTIKWYKNNIL